MQIFEHGPVKLVSYCCLVQIESSDKKFKKYSGGNVEMNGIDITITIVLLALIASSFMMKKKEEKEKH